METFFAAISQQLKTDFTLPQESNTSEKVHEKAEESKNLLKQLISGIFQVVNRFTGWVDASFGDLCSHKREEISLET